LEGATLLTNIRLECKWLAVANTLGYNNAVLVTAHPSGDPYTRLNSKGM